MNPFEKIFNYQIITRLDDSGTFMITSQERAWLKTMLQHPAASEAFTSATLNKLRIILEQDQQMELSDQLIEKAKSVKKQVYHPHLRELRRMIMNKSGIRLTYEVKGGRFQEDQDGVPYKLEYSIVKREWYLLWFHMRRRAFMSTRLCKIHTFSSIAIQPDRADRILSRIQDQLETRRIEVAIAVQPEYNRELSRILYAFSCFEKDVSYNEEQDSYQIRIWLLAEESEFLLSKIRFLGKRVRVMQGDYLKKRMLEASTKALERYGVAKEHQQPTGSTVSTISAASTVSN